MKSVDTLFTHLTFKKYILFLKIKMGLEYKFLNGFRYSNITTYFASDKITNITISYRYIV